MSRLGHGEAERPPAPAGARAHRIALRVLLWSAVALVALCVLVVAAAVALDTAPGHRFVAARVAQLDTQGLRLQVGRIDGSIYGRMVLREVAVQDQKGLVATSPAVLLDWDPRALLRRRVHLEELSSDLVRLFRQPVLKPSTGKSRMPSLTYKMDRLAVATLVLEPALTGQRRAISILASADVAHGRTLLSAQARTRPLPGAPAAGDVAVVRLDAWPAANRLQIAAHVAGPQDGVIDRLLKLGAPITVDVTGRGDWRDWRGRAEAAIGGASVLDAALGAQNGRFTAAGSAQPGRLFKSLARLTRPAVRFDLAASVQGPHIAMEGRLSSAELTAEIAGGVDRERRLLQGVRVNAGLVDPSALSPQLNGRDVRLALALDGAFERPLVNYDFTARSLGYGKITAEAVAAHGRSARTPDGTVHIPVSLTAARLSGFSPRAGPLTAVSLTGPVVIQRDGAVSADLQLRSTRLAANLSLRGSQPTASYAGTLQARLDAEAVNQLGLNGVLGGTAALRTDFRSSRRVPLEIANLTLASPQLRITNANAAYGADGRISLLASVVSTKYGAAQLTVGGTRSAVQAHLSAPNAKLPGQITRLEASLGPAGAGAYRLTATAASPSGPMTVDAVVRTAAPLTLALNRAQWAGLSLAGTVSRSAAGPFTGALTVAGDGLNGSLQLLAQGAVQAAALDLRAANASLPLTQPLYIRSGQIGGQAVLAPGSPALSARLSLADVQSGGVKLVSARADANYRNGVGRATFAASGDTGARFQLAGDVSLTPALVRIGAQGEVEGVRLRLASPAQITREGAEWRLAPATILTSDGRIVVAGACGAGLSLSAQLQQVDLSLVHALRPELGVSGRLSGEADLDLPKGGSPSGRLALQVAKLTRTGATSVSPPLDVSVLGDLQATGGEARAVVRERGAVIGRLQARLAMPTAGALSDRLRAGQLSGGVRYNGQADALMTLAGMGGQQLTGPVAIGADLSGPAAHPQLRGVLYGRDLDYQNARYGTHINGLAVEGRFAGTRLELVSLTGSTSGGGRISANGYADLSAANGWPISLSAKLDKAQLAESDRVGAKLSGTLDITNDARDGGRVTGDLTVDTARYEVTHTATAEAAELSGVRWKGQTLQVSQTTPAASGPPSRWRLNVRVRAPNRIMVNGMGLESEWRADLVVRGDTTHPRIIGDVRSVRGTYSFGGRRLTLADSVIHFDGSDPPNPILDISASANVSSVLASINVGGTATHPEITFSSTPQLPEDEVLSQLLFGGSTAQLSPFQAIQLAASLNALRGGGGGLGALARLSRATGMQNLRFEETKTAKGQSPAVGAGRYITSNIYVDVLVDARGATATQLEVALTPALSLLSQISTFGTTSASIRYTHRY
jgi:translocation and assembly module TamB